MEDNFREVKTINTRMVFFRRKAEASQKGVGGFRPVINWREIAIHRKKLADKQIMACVLVVGSIIIATGILLLILGLFVIKPQCPFQWSGMQDRCLYVTSHVTSWGVARAFCAEQGGALVDISDQSENDEVKEKLSGNAWIGLFRPRGTTTFQWVTGAPLAFTLWVRTPDPFATAITECAKMERSGFWTAETNCSQHFAAACEYQKSYYPFVLIGPVLIVCGVIVLLLSIEVCIRHRKTLDKVRSLVNQEEPSHYDEALRTEGPRTATSGRNHQASTEGSIPYWWRLTNKTAPSNPNFPPEAIDSGRGESANETRPILQEQEVSPTTTCKGTARLLSSKGALDSDSQEQEQLELLLSPKNLR